MKRDIVILVTAKDKTMSVVCYIGHGRSMEKQQRNVIARA